MIKELTMIKDLMIKDKLEQQDKDAVRDLECFKRGTKDETYCQL